MQPECIFVGHTGAISSVSIPYDGAICTGSHDGTFKTWNNNGEAFNNFRAHNTKILSCASALEGRLIATGSNFGSVRLWSMTDKKALRIMNVNHGKAPIVSIACAVRQPIENLLVLEKTKSTGKLTDGNTGRAPDGIVLVSGASDGTVKLWDVNHGSLLRTFMTPSLCSVELSPRGFILVTGCDSGTAKLWNVETGEEWATFSDDSDGITAVTFSPDESNLLVACGSTAILLDVYPISVKQSFHGHKRSINCLAFKPNDYRYFVTGSDDKTVKLWKVRSKEAIFTFHFHTAPVRSVAFSPSGSHVLTGSDDKTAALWDLSSLGSKVLDASLSPFFRLLDEVEMKASDSSLYDLNKELTETVSDVQELRLFYSLLNNEFKRGEITKAVRDEHLAKVLEGATENSFKFDPESRVYSMLVLILNKAMEDHVITEHDRIRLEAEYGKSNVFVDYRFQSLVAAVKRHSHQISSLANYVQEIDDRLKKEDKKGKIMGGLGWLFDVIPALGDMPFVTKAVEYFFEAIVDFSDRRHVYKTCIDHFGDRNDMVQAANKLIENPATELKELELENDDLMPVAAVIKLSTSVPCSDGGSRELKLLPRALQNAPAEAEPANVGCISQNISQDPSCRSHPREVGDPPQTSQDNRRALALQGQSVRGLIPIPLQNAPAEAEPANVQALLVKLGLTHHQDAFDENAIIDICDVLDLTDKDLEDIGLKKIGERNRMRSWIAKRKHRGKERRKAPPAADPLRLSF
jgi:WD40 repeat protein